MYPRSLLPLLKQKLHFVRIYRLGAKITNDSDKQYSVDHFSLKILGRHLMRIKTHHDSMQKQLLTKTPLFVTTEAASQIWLNGTKYNTVQLLEFNLHSITHTITKLHPMKQGS